MKKTEREYLTSAIFVAANRMFHYSDLIDHLRKNEPGCRKISYARCRAGFALKSMVDAGYVRHMRNRGFYKKTPKLTAEMYECLRPIRANSKKAWLEATHGGYRHPPENDNGDPPTNHIEAAE
jgi:hypothetical protein